jgi:hypothetical protein
MKLNPKVTGGLAWAGLIVILAVPGADMLTKQPAESGNRIGTVEPVRTSVVAPSPATAADRPAVVETAAGGDPVESYVSSGKKLPSYISDAPAEVAATKPATGVRLVAPAGPASAQEPATATAPAIQPVVAPGSTAPVEVASVNTVAPVVAPQPYPASLRPKAPAVLVTQPGTTAAAEAPLILDEELVARREAAVAAVLDDAEPVRRNRVVSGDDLEEWDSGSLADYLERRGYMSEDEAQAANDSGEFDEDGFFLDEGPNDNDGRRVIRRLPRRSNDFFLF